MHRCLPSTLDVHVYVRAYVHEHVFVHVHYHHAAALHSTLSLCAAVRRVTPFAASLAPAATLRLRVLCWDRDKLLLGS
jgi:hypothetical protein